MKTKEELLEALHTEKRELDEKIARARSFTLTEDFKALSKQHKGYLKDQIAAMREYSNCLGCRIMCIESGI